MEASSEDVLRLIAAFFSNIGFGDSFLALQDEAKRKMGVDLSTNVSLRDLRDVLSEYLLLRAQHQRRVGLVGDAQLTSALSEEVMGFVTKLNTLVDDYVQVKEQLQEKKSIKTEEKASAATATNSTSKKRKDVSTTLPGNKKVVSRPPEEHAVGGSASVASLSEMVGLSSNGFHGREKSRGFSNDLDSLKDWQNSSGSKTHRSLSSGKLNHGGLKSVLSTPLTKEDGIQQFSNLSFSLGASPIERNPNSSSRIRLSPLESNDLSLIGASALGLGDYDIGKTNKSLFGNPAAELSLGSILGDIGGGKSNFTHILQSDTASKNTSKDLNTSLLSIGSSDSAKEGKGVLKDYFPLKQQSEGKPKRKAANQSISSETSTSEPFKQKKRRIAPSVVSRANPPQDEEEEKKASSSSSSSATTTASSSSSTKPTSRFRSPRRKRPPQTSAELCSSSAKSNKSGSKIENLDQFLSSVPYG